MFVLSLLFTFLNLYVVVFGTEKHSQIKVNEEIQFASNLDSRYLMYDVNPGEGFNLRRDVYIRMANLVKLLNKKESWTLVLPPWSRLYHWRSELIQENIEWSLYFDLDSFKKHIPVIEFSEFLKVLNGSPMDEVIYFQHYKEGWGEKGWEEKMEERECINKNPFKLEPSDHLYHWYMPNITSLRFRCISIQAEYSFLVPFLLDNCTSKSVFFPRGEQVMHGKFSEWSKEFWTARRSMRFSRELRKVGNDYRKRFLNSDDEKDATILEEDWRQMKRKHGEARGGEYLAVHLRRQDFLVSHEEEVPSLEEAAKQIDKELKKLKLKKVFVATDAPRKEFKKLKSLIKEGEVFRFEADPSSLEHLLDGGVAIVDQWICVHAKYFIGTKTSTFSFRIHEEREILGFSPDSTFNCFCPKADESCEQPTKWTIVYK